MADVGAAEVVSDSVIVEPDGTVFPVSKWAVCDGCKVEDHARCVMPISEGVCCCE